MIDVKNAPASNPQRKKVAHRYAISIPSAYREKLLVGFKGIGSAEFFRQHTNELWKPPYCELTCAQYGAFRRILAMFTRDKHNLNGNFMLVTKKELGMHGISEHLLEQIKTKMTLLEISLVTDDGEIKDLPWD